MQSTAKQIEISTIPSAIKAIIISKNRLLVFYELSKSLDSFDKILKSFLVSF